MWVAEHRRWFDHWLKGIDNGVMREPHVRYTVANGDPTAFTSSATWPPKGARTLELHLHQGSLQQTPPTDAAADTHAVDFDITVAERLSKGSAYVSPPFDDGLLITGHPTMRLWVSSTATDGDFIAYVQDVAPDGSAREITDGRLRASLRALHAPPYRNNGLPWHRAHAQDARPLQSGQPAELWFELQPIAWRLERGHRLRVLLTHAIPAKSNGADLFNETPRLTPAPVVTIHSSPQLRSLLSLPVA
jgi:predicted acyl esterase